MSTLLYCLGDAAEDVLSSTGITAEEYDTVMAKFDAFFKVRADVIFNWRCRRDGETAEEYITTLYGLVQTCNYRALQEEML